MLESKVKASGSTTTCRHFQQGGSPSLALSAKRVYQVSGCIVVMKVRDDAPALA